MNKTFSLTCFLFLAFGLFFSETTIGMPQSNTTNSKPIIVGSKTFTESYLLAEIMAQALESEGLDVTRTFGLGGTLICYGALVDGSLDVYAEYSGTLGEVILKTTPLPDAQALQTLLAFDGIASLGDFGLNNTYAIAMKDELAKSRNIKTISDLKNHPDLKIAFSTEFMNRVDGWPGIKAKYNLTFDPKGIEHGLAYQAIENGQIQITDAYSTDGDLERYNLTTLVDDLSFFPSYNAFPLIRKDLPQKAQDILQQLAGSLTDAKMRALNSEVVIEERSFAEVAKSFLKTQDITSITAEVKTSTTIIKNTLVHLKLTGIALSLGIIVGLGLALMAFRYAALSRVLIYITGLMQTIPSIALLALMIPLVGIGEVPAIIALFLYSLLPILRNSITGLVTIDPKLKRMAEALGLTEAQQLKHILVPLAFPQILAGIKTAAIISIGTATLAAFIGAGGLGEPIVTGLALNDTNLILQGALPAAGLAIMVEFLFEIIEKLTVKDHMRLGKLSD